MKTLFLLPFIFFGLTAGAKTINNAPTANAGPDQTIYLTQTSSFTLNGSGTGTGITYQWTKISTDQTDNAAIISSTSASTTVTGLRQGTWYYQLTVTDNVSAVVKDTVVISVEYATPPTNLGIMSQTVFSDMAAHVNLRDDTTSYFPLTDQLHSVAGTLPNRFYLYRDRTNGMLIDNARGKLYTTIEDGYGQTYGYARSELSIDNDIDNFPLDSNTTYMFEWRGYLLQPYTGAYEATVATIFQIHANNGVSPPFCLGIHHDSLSLFDNMQVANGTGATPPINPGWYSIKGISKNSGS